MVSLEIFHKLRALQVEGTRGQVAELRLLVRLLSDSHQAQLGVNLRLHLLLGVGQSCCLRCFSELDCGLRVKVFKIELFEPLYSTAP